MDIVKCIPNDIKSLIFSQLYRYALKNLLESFRWDDTRSCYFTKRSIPAYNYRRLTGISSEGNVWGYNYVEQSVRHYAGVKLPKTYIYSSGLVSLDGYR